MTLPLGDFLVKCRKGKVDLVGLARALWTASAGTGLWTGSAANLAVTIVGMVLRFASGIVLARALGTTEYGQYAVFMVYIESARSISLLGMQVPITRYTALYEVRGDWRSVNGVMFIFSICVAVLSLLGAIALLSALLLFEPVALQGVDSTIIFAGATIIIFGNIETVRISVLAGLGRVAVSKMPQSIVTPSVKVGGALGLLYLCGQSISVDNMIVIAIIAAALAMFTGIVSLRVILTSEQLSAGRKTYTIAWIRDTVPFVGIGVLFPISAQIDALMMSVLAPPAEVALFAIAIQLIIAVTLPFAIILPVAYPRFVKYFDVDDTNGVVRMCGFVAYGSVAAALPAALVLFFWGRPIVTAFFGTEFAGAAEPLAVLAGAHLLLLPLLVAPQIFTAAARAGILLRRVPFAIALSAGLNLLLVPRYGATGAALSMAASLLFYNGWLAHSCSTRLGINWLPSSWLKAVRA